MNARTTQYCATDKLKEEVIATPIRPRGTSLKDVIAQVEASPAGKEGMDRARRRVAALKAENKLVPSIRNLRIAAGLSQQQIANAAQMSQAQVARFEAGQGDPRISSIERIASALSTSSTQIMAAFLQQKALLQPSPQ